MKKIKKSVGGLVENSLDFFNKGEVIRSSSALERNDITFNAKELIQVTFPHSKPKEKRIDILNGSLTVSMVAGAKTDLPYGSYPRLILFWLTHEAMKNKRSSTTNNKLIINMGNSMSNFMRELGIEPSGGTRGQMTSFKKQLKNLLNTGISVEWSGVEQGNNFESISNAWVTDEAKLWWSDKNNNQESLFGAEVKLSEKFFNLITNNPIPLDMGMLKLIKQSALAIDLYSFITYRVYSLKRDLIVPWRDLMNQLGSEYKKDRKGINNFKSKVENQLLKIKSAWPSLKYESTKEGLIIFKQTPHIPTRNIYELD